MKTIVTFLLMIFVVSCAYNTKSKNSLITDNKTEYNNIQRDTNTILLNKYNLEINRKYEKLLTKEYFYYMGEYTLRHYGYSNVYMESPKVIVIHSTASETLMSAINTFAPDVLKGRGDIKNGGEVNVGTHFVVDKDGTIYSVIPIEFVARHTIGLNYTAISIENIGMPNTLTEEQLNSNIKLVNFLKSEFSSIEYLIGHYEYNDKTKAHYKLIKNIDENYKFSIKIDPSSDFMKRLKNGIDFTL